MAFATAPEPGQGRRAAPSGDACLDPFVPGGRAPQIIGASKRGPTEWGRPLSSAAVGGVLWQTPQHPTAVKAEERRRQATRALTAVVPGGRAPQQNFREAAQAARVAGWLKP